MTAPASRELDAPETTSEARPVDRPLASRLLSRGRPGSERTGLWFVVTLVATFVAALIPIYFFHRYYFTNDTETGAFGIWYRLGMEIRAGHIQTFNPHVWMSGNYVAEGQWGFFSPIILLIGLLASYTTNAALFCTGVKIVFMLVASGGVFLLSRSFGADSRWSMVAGVAAPLCGFGMYMDETAWVTELMIWALLPWFWVALRRTIHDGKNPALAMITAYLVITIGYVYGAIGVVFVLLAVGVERILVRDWRGVRRTLGVGVVSGLVTITVYLPGVLTSSVTWRRTGIENDAFLQPTLTGLITSPEPTALSALKGFWAGGFPHTPLMYIAWFLPLIVLIDWHALAQHSRKLTDAWIGLVLFTMLLFAPAQIGPLRFPVRNIGLFVVVLLPMLVAFLTQARAPRSRGRLYALAAVILTVAYFSFAQKPVTSHTLLAATFVIAVGCFVVWRSSPTREHSGRPWPLPAAVAVMMAVISIAFVGLQHHSYRRSDLLSLNLPTSVAAYKNLESRDTGDGIVVGGVRLGSNQPAYWKEMLLANSWYIGNDHSFQNVYSTIGYGKYADVVCMDYLGSTCPDLINRLFTQRAATGLLLVDELDIDTVQIIKASVSQSIWSTPNPGWSITSNLPLTVTWTRDHPIGPAGQPIQSSPGLTISDVKNGDSTVSFKVDQIPSNGGGVTFSRLNWPGYSATNASIGDPVDSFLLHVTVPASSRGKVVTVSFLPPGWTLGKGTLVLGIGGGLIWSLAEVVRRRRKDEPAPSKPEPVEV